MKVHQCRLSKFRRAFMLEINYEYKLNIHHIIRYLNLSWPSEAKKKKTLLLMMSRSGIYIITDKKKQDTLLDKFSNNPISKSSIGSSKYKKEVLHAEQIDHWKTFLKSFNLIYKDASLCHKQIVKSFSSLSILL